MSMQSVASIVTNYKIPAGLSVEHDDTEQTSEKTRWSVDKRNHIQRAVNYLFEIFERAWPEQFAKKYGNNDARMRTKSIWRECYQFGVLTPQQIRAGVDLAVTQKWMPGLADFLQLCPSDMVSPEAAWLEACNHSHEINNHNWSSPEVRQAGYLTGWHSIRAAVGNGVDAVRRTYVDHYKTLCNKQSAGIKTKGTHGPALEDHHTGKTAAELVEQRNVLETKNRIMADGYAEVRGMSDVMAIMGE